jgi:hypothetical protein
VMNIMYQNDAHVFAVLFLVSVSNEVSMLMSFQFFYS